MAFNDCLMGEIWKMIVGCHASFINDQKAEVVLPARSCYDPNANRIKENLHTNQLPFQERILITVNIIPSSQYEACSIHIITDAN